MNIEDGNNSAHAQLRLDFLAQTLWRCLQVSYIRKRKNGFLKMHFYSSSPFTDNLRDKDNSEACGK